MNLDEEEKIKEEKDNIDWNDGEVHTTSEKYVIDDKENWHKNVAYNMRSKYGPNNHIRDNLYIKGKQVGFHYETNDPKVTIPVYIVCCIILIVISIVVLKFNIIFGIFISIFSLVWIAGSLVQNIKRWKKLIKNNNEKDEK